MRPPVDGAGHKFFARPGFACDQNTGVRGSDLGYKREYSLQRGRGSDDLVAHRCLIDLLAQSDVLMFGSLLRVLWIRDAYSDASHEVPP